LRFIVEIVTTRPTNIVGVFANALHGGPASEQSHARLRSGENAQVSNNKSEA
jgi:hypothetical protein